MEQKSTDELAKILWDYNNLHQDPVPSDILIALGSHDLRVAERTAELYLQGLAPLIVFTGGRGRLTPSEWSKAEAEMFMDVAINKGVSQEKVIIEVNSTNTGENIRYTKQLLEENGITFSKVILVTKPYMERRVYATWLKYFPDTPAVLTSPQISYEDYPTDNITKDDSINIVVGDTQRIKEYPARGYQVEQEMPHAVWQACQELMRRGYTKELIKPL